MSFILSAYTFNSNAAVNDFLIRSREKSRATTEIIPLDEVDEWIVDDLSVRHISGAFFKIVGLRVHIESYTWDQPIIDQPEVGILGTAVRVRDGVTMECLMQAKAEPGTVGGVQLGPTVQATKSNYSRRHGGREIPYLNQFLGDAATVQGFDIAQSEQGARFLEKNNRNIVVFVNDDTPVHDSFAWFSIGDVHRALGTGDLVNFDARTVLAGLGALDAWRAIPDSSHDDISALLSHSLADMKNSQYNLDMLLAWLRIERNKLRRRIERVSLSQLREWRRYNGRIIHSRGGFFQVVGARISAVGREVDEWCQPLIIEENTALLGLAVAVINGTVHVLLRATPEPGLTKGVELGPTVQVVPKNYRCLPELPRPTGWDIVDVGNGSVIYDQTLSGEGGRFYKARQRHLIVLIDRADEPPGYRWVSLYQFAELIRRGHLVNEQARSLFACLLSRLTPLT